jgi:deoxyribodipyrimidine photo-lyase
MVNPKRVRLLHEGQAAAGPVLYWMSRDQRAQDNWALLFAQELALERQVPLVVAFCLVRRFLGAGRRQYGFMLRGLAELEQSLAAKGIPFCLLHGAPQEELPEFVQEHGIAQLVTDQWQATDSYELRVQVLWTTPRAYLPVVVRNRRP